MANDTNPRARLSAEWVNDPEGEGVGTHSIQLTGTTKDLIVLFAEVGLALHDKGVVPLDYLALAVLEAERLKGFHHKYTSIDMSAIKRAMDAEGRE